LSIGGAKVYFPGRIQQHDDDRSAFDDGPHHEAAAGFCDVPGLLDSSMFQVGFFTKASVLWNRGRALRCLTETV
jgi:hypothetical protein